MITQFRGSRTVTRCSTPSSSGARPRTPNSHRQLIVFVNWLQIVRDISGFLLQKLNWKFKWRFDSQNFMLLRKKSCKISKTNLFSWKIVEKKKYQTPRTIFRELKFIEISWQRKAQYYWLILILAASSCNIIGWSWSKQPQAVILLVDLDPGCLKL